MQPVRPALEQIGAGGAKKEERRTRRVGGDVLNQVEESVFRPVDVFEDDHERSPRRLELEELARTPEHLIQREVGLRQTDRRRNAGDDLLGFRPRELKEPGVGLVGRVVVTDSRGLADDLNEGPEGDAPPIRKTLAANHPGF